jgi:hypothetical protein
MYKLAYEKNLLKNMPFFGAFTVTVVGHSVSHLLKAFWENKQNLMKEFIEQLSFDLGIHEDMKVTSKGGLS